MNTYTSESVEGCKSPNDGTVKVHGSKVLGPPVLDNNITTSKSSGECSPATGNYNIMVGDRQKDYQQCPVEKEVFQDKLHEQKIICRIIDNDKCWVCQQCGQVFKRKGTLVCHLRRHTGEMPFSCLHCSRRFTHKSTLLHHSRLHTGEKPYKCEVCNKKFRQRSNYYLHKKSHTNEKLFICEVCGKQFVQRVHLTTHSRLHTGDKPFSCNDCEKTFSQRGHLNRHQMIHSSEKPYECSVCDKKFACGEYLSSHIRTSTHNRLHHQQKDSEKCLVNTSATCSSSSSNQQSDELKKSILSFLKQDKLDEGSTAADKNQRKKTRHIECDYCQKRFNKKTHLRSHIFTHTGEKPFACKRCERKFSEKGSLTRHMKVHSRTHSPTMLMKQQGRHCNRTLQDNCKTNFVSDPVISSQVQHAAKEQYSTSVTPKITMYGSQNTEQNSTNFLSDEICIPETRSGVVSVWDTLVEPTPPIDSGDETVTLYFERKDEPEEEQKSRKVPFNNLTCSSPAPNVLEVNVFLFDQPMKEECKSYEATIKQEIEIVEETVDEYSCSYS